MLADDFSGAVSTTGTVTLNLSGKNVEVVDEFRSRDDSSWELKCTATLNSDSSYDLFAEATYQGTPPPDLSYGRLEPPAVTPQSSWAHCGVQQNSRSSCQYCGAARPPCHRFTNGTDYLKHEKAIVIAKGNTCVHLRFYLFHIKKAPVKETNLGNASLACLLTSSLATGWGADVVFVVGAEEVSAHSLVLTVASEVFSAMFEHDTSDKATRRVNIKDANPLPFKEMIRCVYTDSLPECPDDAFLVELLTLSDRYGLKLLLAQCQTVYIDTMSVDNVSSRLRYMMEVPSLPLVEATLAYFMKRAAPDSWTAAIRDNHPGLAVLLSRGSPRSRAPEHQTRVRSTLGNPGSSNAAP